MTAQREPEIIDAELVEPIDLDALVPQPVQRPPALRVVCACGKNGTPEAHGYNPITGHPALTCEEVLETRARVEADLAREQRPLGRLVRLIRKVRGE